MLINSVSEALGAHRWLVPGGRQSVTGGQKPTGGGIEVVSWWTESGASCRPQSEGEVQREVLSPRACPRAMGRKEPNAG